MKLTPAEKSTASYGAVVAVVAAVAALYALRSGDAYSAGDGVEVYGIGFASWSQIALSVAAALGTFVAQTGWPLVRKLATALLPLIEKSEKPSDVFDGIEAVIREQLTAEIEKHIQAVVESLKDRIGKAQINLRLEPQSDEQKPF